MKRFNITIIFGAIFVLLISQSFLAKAEDYTSNKCPIHFVVIGDRTGENVPGIYEQIVKEIERLKPDFVITVGDMIEGPENNEKRIREKWEEYGSIVSQLSMPIYYTPGNNDISSDFMENSYLEYIGKPYYSFDFKDLHFIILDNSRWSSSNELPEKQINWLIDDLQANNNTGRTFVFCHKPFWEKSIVAGKPDTLHSIFKNHNVDALFSGHYHAYLSGEYDNILYTNVGSSGGSFEQPGATGLEYHFVWVTVDKNGIFISPIKIGAVLPWDEITADENKFVYHAQQNCISFAKPFTITEKALAQDTGFEVTIRNFSQEFELVDTIKWDVASGWIVEPQSMSIAIDTNSTKSFFFNITNQNTIYPAPNLSFRFPYAENKTALASSGLSIARQTDCFMANKKPIIDGDISEEIWQNPVTKLLSMDGGMLKSDSANFFFAYDQKNLYLAALCTETEIDSITADIKEHDGAIYGEDCVGYILQPDPNKDDMYLVYFNPLGVVFDQKITKNEDGYFQSDPSWNCDYEVKTSRGDNYWSIEVCIPSSQFGISIEKDQKWGLNMRRKQPRLNEAAHWQIPWRYGPDLLGKLIMQ